MEFNLLIYSHVRGVLAIFVCLEGIRSFSDLALRGPGGGLYRNSLEIDFIVVSDRGE